MIAVSDTITSATVLRGQGVGVDDRVRRYSRNTENGATATVLGFLPTGAGRSCIQVVVRPDEPTDPANPEECWNWDETELLERSPQS